MKFDHIFKRTVSESESTVRREHPEVPDGLLKNVMHVNLQSLWRK